MGKMRGYAAVVALALTTSGCWLQAGHNSGRGANNDLESTITAANVADLELAWTADVCSAAQEAVVSGGTTFVRCGFTTEGGVFAFATDTGALRWANAPADNSLAGLATPAVVDNQLRVPTFGRDCGVTSLSLATGEVVSTHSFGSGGNTSWFASECSPADALAIGNRLVVPWTWRGVVQVPLTQCRQGFFGYTATGFNVIDLGAGGPDGGSSVRQPFGCGISPDLPTGYGDAATELGGEIVRPSGSDGLLTAYPGDCGPGCAALWSFDATPATISPAVATSAGDLAVAATDGTVLVVDGSSHALEWTGVVGAPLAQPLAATGSTIFAVATDGTVAAFPVGGCGSASCAPTWTATLASPASVRASIGGDVLYVGSANGVVSALPAAGCGAAVCPPLWSAATGSEITGAPVVSNGVVTVGSADGTVTSFALP